MAAVRHLRFLNIRNISCWSGVLFSIICVRTQKFLSYASSAIFRMCYPRPRYGVFLIFQDSGHHHLGFLKFQIFNGRDAQEGRTTSSFKISSKTLKPWLRYGHFSIFLIWRSPPSWIFQILNLMVGTVKGVKLHQRTKFRQNRLNRG